MTVKDTYFSKKPNMNIKGKLFDLTEPCVMGIMNITPDSFYKGSRFVDEEHILMRAAQILSEGGKIIDIGAQSTRPGAENITEETEKERLKPALKIIRQNFPEAIISLDTFSASVAKWAIHEFGIDIVNDISGGLIDNNMIQLIARENVPYILMHMRGTPKNMTSYSNYTLVTKEVISEISIQLKKLRDAGVNDIIIDPGFGFAKNIDQNYTLLNELNMLKIFELPILVGLSRKSMIYNVLKILPEEALNGSTVLNTTALLNGADILRVHDVKEATEAIKIAMKLNK
jgi:dihydropteroate synthase